MRRRLIVVLCLAGCLFVAASPDHSAAPAGIALLCRFQDKKIDESSGVASSSRSERYFFTHNDSGDSSRFFAAARDGRTLATYDVQNARNRDWEDMARTVDERGRPVLLLGDIGDNNAEHPSIVLYRVAEPEVDVSQAGVKRDLPSERFELTYPDGAKDCETLLADPTGRVYLVTKSPTGSLVYAAPFPMRQDKPNALKRIGAVNFFDLPSSAQGVRSQIGRLLATGGAISPDGKRLVIRTYRDAYEWPVRKNDVAAALKGNPIHVQIPGTSQGEAITYAHDGRSLLMTSEGKNAPVHILRRR